MLILGRKEMIKLVESYPNQYSVVAIHEHEMRHQVAHIVPLCDCFTIGCEDSTFEDRPESPTKQMVQDVLEWAKSRDQEQMVVACAAGVSRSSAIAFLIRCLSVPPEEAAKIWDIRIHRPNELILQFGTEIFGEHLRPVIKKYYIDYSAYKGWPLDWVTKFFRH